MARKVWPSAPVPFRRDAGSTRLHLSLVHPSRSCDCASAHMEILNGFTKAGGERLLIKRIRAVGAHDIRENPGQQCLLRQPKCIVV